MTRKIFFFPDFEQLNAILLSGVFGRLVEWEPFEITENEYSEILEQLLSISMNRSYRKG